MNFGSTRQGLARHLERGPGVGSIADVPTVAECVARLREEYAAAARDLTRTEHWPASPASS